MTNSPQGFKDDSNGTFAGDPSDDYTYDLNGNMTADENKIIKTISYNHLNLPKRIVLDTGLSDNIQYFYDATGIKLKKIVTDVRNNTVTTTEYLHGFQYKNNVLQFFPTAEGYVNSTLVNGSNTYNYVYNYADHLGNIRLSYTKDPTTGTLKIIEENHNYPFGLKHNYNTTDYQFTPSGSGLVLSQVGENGYNYQYQGQEHQDELNLNWDSFKWRNYDYAIGRFMSIDPLAEKFVDISPFQFAHNNPIWKIELEGLEGIRSQEFDANGNFKNHLIEKNVIVLTRKPIEKQQGISENDSNKIDRKNARISNQNASRVQRVKNDLETNYSNSENSLGEKVVFKFNVTEAAIVDKNLNQSTGALISLAKENGLSSSENSNGGTHVNKFGNKLSIAAIITTGNEGSAGLTTGNFRISINNSTSGVISHEVGHTLMDRGDGNNSEHSEKGLMTVYANDISKITPTEVDKMLNDAYQK